MPLCYHLILFVNCPIMSVYKIQELFQMFCHCVLKLENTKKQNNDTMRKCCWRDFIWMVTPQNLFRTFKSKNNTVSCVYKSLLDGLLLLFVIPEILSSVWTKKRDIQLDNFYNWLPSHCSQITAFKESKSDCRLWRKH